MNVPRWVLVGMAIAGLIGVSAGCNRSKSTDEANADSGPHAAGKRVFAANCARCHSMGGGSSAGAGSAGGAANPADAPQPGRPEGGGAPGGMGGGMGRGPDLAHAGSDPNHTVDWLMAYIRDPKSKKPNSRMPPMNRLSDEDIRAVAEYLASLK